MCHIQFLHELNVLYIDAVAPIWYEIMYELI